jgi:hypothetical protein
MGEGSLALVAARRAAEQRLAGDPEQADAGTDQSGAHHHPGRGRRGHQHRLTARGDRDRRHQQVAGAAHHPADDTGTQRGQRHGHGDRCEQLTGQRSGPVHGGHVQRDGDCQHAEGEPGQRRDRIEAASGVAHQAAR